MAVGIRSPLSLKTLARIAASALLGYALASASWAEGPAEPVAAQDAFSPANPASAGRNLTSAVEPLWIDLSDSQRDVLARFETQWNTWPSDEKRVWVVLATRFPDLPPQAKGKALLRIREWAALSPNERLVARQNYQLARERDKDKRGQEWRKYQEMTPEQRSVLRANGTVSNTAAGRTPPSGLAREAAQPLSIKPVSNFPADR